MDDTTEHSRRRVVGALSLGMAAVAAPQSQIRVLRQTCTDSTCTVSCNQDEVLVSAYCGPNRLNASVLSEGSVSCGVVPDASRSPLVAICVSVKSR